MSVRVDLDMPTSCTRPTPSGSRRRPRSRQHEFVRPAQVYRIAVRMQLARMSVIDRLRDAGYGRD